MSRCCPTLVTATLVPLFLYLKSTTYEEQSRQKSEILDFGYVKF
jgi:hypothetical protein